MSLVVSAGSFPGKVAFVCNTPARRETGLAGVHCVIVELLTAAVPLAVLVLWRRVEGISRASVAGVAASGALAGDATLHISCSAADSILHLLVLHVGGVALAGALAGLIAGHLLRVGAASP